MKSKAARCATVSCKEGWCIFEFPWIHFDILIFYGMEQVCMHNSSMMLCNLLVDFISLFTSTSARSKMFDLLVNCLSVVTKY